MLFSKYLYPQKFCLGNLFPSDSSHLNQSFDSGLTEDGIPNKWKAPTAASSN